MQAIVFALAALACALGQASAIQSRCGALCVGFTMQKLHETDWVSDLTPFEDSRMLKACGRAVVYYSERPPFLKETIE